MPNKESPRSIAPLRPKMSDSLPYNGVKQQMDSENAVAIYDDWFDRLKYAPIGESNVATIVPGGRLNLMRAYERRERTIQCAEKHGGPYCS